MFFGFAALGIALGFVIGLFINMWADIWRNLSSRQEIAILVSSIVLLGGLGGGFGGKLQNYECGVFLGGYEATATLYEASLVDDRLGGFERIELVKMANEANSKLAKYKVLVDQWWIVGISEENRNKVKELELIM